MSFSTLGADTVRIFKKEESYCITEGYTASAAMQKGAVVKLNTTTNEVEPIAAATDLPFGVLTVGCNAAGEKVTVITQFSAISKVQLTANVALGAKLTANGYDTSTKYAKAATSATTQTVFAIALEAGSTSDVILVGVLRTFNVLD